MTGLSTEWMASSTLLLFFKNNFQNTVFKTIQSMEENIPLPLPSCINVTEVLSYLHRNILLDLCASLGRTGIFRTLSLAACEHNRSSSPGTPTAVLTHTQPSADDVLSQ